MTAVVKAVLDVGSNSVLTLVAQKAGERWETVFESSEVTGLGEGTKRTGVLSDLGMERTLAAVARGFERARAHGAQDVVAAATMAARIASNTDAFLSAAEKQATPIQVLSGEHEAQLGFLAVATDPAFAADERISIVDPGGNSTELLTAQRDQDGWQVLFRRSYPLGALGLRDGVLHTEQNGFREILGATSQIDDTIGLEYLPHQCGRVVVLGATGTNLVSIREHMTEWQPERVHGSYLDYEEISKAVGWMMGMTDAQRAAIPGIERGRERTIHIGALILERFLMSLHALGATVSIRGWRHALLEGGLPAPDPD